MPHHIFSLVGDARAGKSYFLSVLTKVLPVSLFRQFGITFQDADPTGNAALNDMRKVLFSAQTPDQAKLAKTQLEGSMYERLPRHGRTVALPKPFVYTLGANTGAGPRCSVILYDNAGEHFQPGLNVVEHPGHNTWQMPPASCSFSTLSTPRNFAPCSPIAVTHN